MDITLQPGRYIIAVSGGVDSVALLDMLAHQPGLMLTVAHFDHGIRSESARDRIFVQTLAARYKLPFVYDEANLGPGSSEERARNARYTFLHTVRKHARAQAIITAHHEDDVIETALMNLMRGTGRKGMSSLRSTDGIVRPLLRVPKSELEAYAQQHGLQWREDHTNQNTKYRRNYVRHTLVPKLTPAHRSTLLGHIRQSEALNHQIDAELSNLFHVQPSMLTLDRYFFVMLPHMVAAEVMAAWLRRVEASFDRKNIHRIVVSAKTFQPKQQIDVNHLWTIVVDKDSLALRRRDR